jgi:hypothetical protein
MFRAGEVDAFIEGLGQTAVGDLLYGNADPDAILGISARLGKLDSRFVIGAGGGGSDLTSIYGITWGQTSAFLIYPKNMTANLGVLHEDEGVLTSETAAGKMKVYRDHFRIAFGLVVRNPRAIIRYANIESAGADNTFYEDDLITLTNNWEKGPGSRLYVNETILSQMQIRAKDKNNVYYTPGGSALSGEPPLYFNGIPIRQMAREILLNTEDVIT